MVGAEVTDAIGWSASSLKPSIGTVIAEPPKVKFPCALALLVCWLWAASRRFGPALLAQRAERRSLVEHIAASGRFLWREARGATLYEAVLDELRQRIRRRHPAWAELPVEEMAQRAATLSGMAPAAVRSALTGGARRREEDFVHDIQTLETLRKRL